MQNESNKVTVPSNEGGAPVQNQNNSQAVAPTATQQPAVDSKITEELNTLKSEMEGIGYIMNAIVSDPALANQVKKRLLNPNATVTDDEGQLQKKESKKDPEIQQLTEKVEGIERGSRLDIIQKFLEDEGITTLPEDKQKEVKQAIESQFRDFGLSVTTVPLAVLKTTLPKALKLVEDKFVADRNQTAQEATNEVEVVKVRNSQGKIPTFVSGTGRNTPIEKRLSNEQRKVAEFLNLDPSEVEKHWQSVDETAE